MIVKVMLTRDDGVAESYYECRRAITRRKDGMIHITCEEKDDHAVEIQIGEDDARAAVFLMNEDGRTVDVIKRGGELTNQRT